MKPASFDNTSDLIDSRDIIDRIADLEEERDGEADRGYLREWNESDEARELAALEALNEEGRDLPDWDSGTTLIKASYFTEYAQQLAEDIGAVSGNEQWPLNCIDWEYAAAELKYDYVRIEFDGTPYYVHGA